MYYFDILRKLFEGKISYLLVGGLAVNLYGVPRATYDMDLVISTQKANVEALLKIFSELGLQPSLPENPDFLSDPIVIAKWIEERNLKAFSFFDSAKSYRVVDIVLDQPLDFEAAYARKTIQKIENFEMYIVSLDDLIEMKVYSGRERDKEDIKYLREIRESY